MTITRESPTAAGCFCCFVQINATHGIKFYETESIRDRAKDLQSHTATFGLAPNVGESCEMPWMISWPRPHRWNSDPTTVHGFITELCNTNPIEEHEFDTLYETLEMHGLGTGDMAPSHNVGRMPDGRCVRYDFDPFFFHCAESESRECTS